VATPSPASEMMEELNGMFVINRDELPYSGSSHELEGYLYGGVPACLIFVDGPPGSGPRLHRHPYAEIFVVLEGQATFTVGEAEIEARGGQILIAPAGVPHKFVNSGDGPLRQIDIHTSERFSTEWLED
jgi:mannose-6-phosphate isomerase-like protein (cupin superfamily)